MTEFKQIVGRGTRVKEDEGKFYFTLMDFRGASSHFADPDFDGDPVQIYEPPTGGPMSPPERTDNDTDVSTGEDEDASPEKFVNPDVSINTTNEPPSRQKKVYVDGVAAIIIAERIEYRDKDGKLVTESLKDYTRRNLLKQFASLDDFLLRWKSADRKQALLDEIEEAGLPLKPIGEELGADLDPFDLICHVAFGASPLTRHERARNVVKRNAFAKYGETARAVLEALLSKYADEGVLNFDDANVLSISPLNRMGTPVELVRAFGGRSGFDSALRDLQSELYGDVG